MIDVLFVDEQVILANTDLMPSVMAVINLATWHRTAQTRFFPQEDHATKTDLLQGINTPTTKVTDHAPIMVLDIADISAGHCPAAITTMTEAALLEGTPHPPLLATAAAYATLLLMDDPVTTHSVTLIGMVTPHPTLTTFPVDITHAIL